MGGIVIYVVPPVYKQALDVGGSVVISAGGGGKFGSVITAWTWIYSQIIVVYVPYTSMPGGNMPFAESCLYGCMFVGVDACVKYIRRKVQKCLLEVCGWSGEEACRESDYIHKQVYVVVPAQKMPVMQVCIHVAGR